jgi:hypothetical protein
MGRSSTSNTHPSVPPSSRQRPPLRSGGAHALARGTFRSGSDRRARSMPGGRGCSMRRAPCRWARSAGTSRIAFARTLTAAAMKPLPPAGVGGAFRTRVVGAHRRVVERVRVPQVLHLIAAAHPLPRGAGGRVRAPAPSALGAVRACVPARARACAARRGVAGESRPFGAMSVCLSGAVRLRGG